MKRVIEFLKISVLGGLFVLLPVLLFYILIQEALGAVVMLATPIADLFPKDTFENLSTPRFVAFLLILGTSFVLGLALRSRILSSIGRWVEKRTLALVPMYDAVKNLTTGFDSSENGFRSALLSSPDGVQELVYLVEQHDDGRSTILVPWAPLAFSGSIKIVPSDRLEVLSAGLADASRVVSLWGVGMRELLDGAPPPADPAGSQASGSDK
jgi:uncharacterized membrane protein